MALEARRFLVQGRVQGVWFRESTRRQALALGIHGQALNLADGRVEVLAWGSPDALQQLAQWLDRGPPLARVDQVLAEAWQGVMPEGFSTG